MGVLGSVNSLREALSTLVIQYEPINCKKHEDVHQNVNHICAIMEGTQVQFPNYDLIVFPEDCLLGDLDPYSDLALSLDDEEVQTLVKKCRELSIWGCFNFHRRHSQKEMKPWNTLIIVDDQGEIVLVYDKVNPYVPSESVTPGNTISVVRGPKGSVLGPMICYDRDFPEVSRELAMKGANVLIAVSCYPSPYYRVAKFLNQARAYENTAYFIACGAVGKGVKSGLQFYGGSMIVNFDGNIIVEAPEGIEYVIKADIYPFLVDSARDQYSSNNYLKHLKHRGSAALPPHGDTSNPYQIYRDWK